MWRPADRWPRLIRSVAAALACVTASAVGHHAAGGVLPAAAVAAAFAGSAAVAWMLSSRRVSPSQLVGLLVLCQVGVHLGASVDQMTMGTAMIAAHVAATAVSAIALSRGEAFVWHLADRLGLRLWLTPSLLGVAAVPRSAVVRSITTPRTLRDVRLAHSLWLRGPPVGVV